MTDDFDEVPSTYQAEVVMQIRDKALELRDDGSIMADLMYPEDAFAHFFVILRHCYNALDDTNDFDLDIG